MFELRSYDMYVEKWRGEVDGRHNVSKYMTQSWGCKYLMSVNYPRFPFLVGGGVTR